MNKFEAEALKRYQAGEQSRTAFEQGTQFGYTAGLEDAARAIEKARSDGWYVYTEMYWRRFIAAMNHYDYITTAELIEKYKME